ncbi:bacteriohemerythrin [Maridesulfovibrio salexigens]|uniref:Hemerythrin-like metal-binding protein n=1 Tax=Maridesulfovibrio salexigens (strain ATCC 14822 / DSM 2638 / NCIMB 8403 / VKM B-1763) TaxID=526222 RepID=C6C1T5_MARSD|nr:hemerythrin family protein [Maridesulfovibrio salexigens]ACS79331.1 hemerythrin-like metal-binding protein [Maridesulfovibrio salexigens DSM 2638]
MDNEKVCLWKAKYLLDIDEVDAQHQHYFSICSKIVNLCDLVRSDKAVRFGPFIVAIFELRSYAFKHFLTEETLLAKYKYPGAFSHIELHDQYLESIRDFHKKIKIYHAQANASVDNAFLVKVEEVVEFALGWWVKHIMEEDRKYADFIKEVGKEQDKNERYLGG